jgi:hypothetical protein
MLGDSLPIVKELNTAATQKMDDNLTVITDNVQRPLQRSKAVLSFGVLKLSQGIFELDGRIVTF